MSLPKITIEVTVELQMEDAPELSQDELYHLAEKAFPSSPHFTTEQDDALISVVSDAILGQLKRPFLAFGTTIKVKK